MLLSSDETDFAAEAAESNAGSSKADDIHITFSKHISTTTQTFTPPPSFTDFKTKHSKPQKFNDPKPAPVKQSSGNISAVFKLLLCIVGWAWGPVSFIIGIIGIVEGFNMYHEDQTFHPAFLLMFFIIGIFFMVTGLLIILKLKFQSMNSRFWKYFKLIYISVIAISFISLFI